jgi:hypothetical protein
MSKKHFIALADVLRDLYPTFGLGIQSEMENGRGDSVLGEGMRIQWENTRDALADFCEQQNREFKRDSWLDYINGNCGPNGGKAAAK